MSAEAPNPTENLPFSPEILEFILNDYNRFCSHMNAQTPIEKVRKTINNIAFWLPHICYRELPDTKSITPEIKSRRAQLIKEMDESITELQLSNLSKDKDDLENLNQLAQLYVALRKKGFTWKEITG